MPFVATEPITTRPDETAVAPPRLAPDGTASGAPVEDIRAARPVIFRPSPLRALARRAASIAALVTLDLVGLTLGLYCALVVREAVRGEFPPLWGVLWRDAAAQWLPFLTLITVLVFAHARLYAAREFRAGLGRIVSSLALVAVLTLAFALGSGHDFDTFGLAPTALVLTATFIGLLRASYEVLTKDIFQ